MPRPIYLDHNATTPIFPEVVEAMRACWSEPYFNPASQHEFGRAARRVLEDARDRIAELLGAGPADRVIFTSGGTEANNVAIRGQLHLPLPPGEGRGEGALKHLITSAIEHPSIATLADHLAKSDVRVDHIPADAKGVIRVSALTTLIRPETTLVAAMLANNETGVFQPVAELAAICNVRNTPLHVDASQAAGKMSLNFRERGPATMSIAAHKFGGPLGIGALVVRGDIELQPQLFGGFQQAGTRPGSESVALAVGMRRALELWNENRVAWTARLRDLRDHFENAILVGYPPAFIIGGKAERLPHVSNIAFVGLDRQQLFIALDQAGVACSTGSACASGSSEPSPVHLAMGLDPAVISSALRFSFGVTTTLDDVTESVDRILNVCNSLRR
jgi:cysteine desulfurase